MGLDDMLKGVARDLGKSLKDLAAQKGNELVAELKGKLASEVEDLKARATNAVQQEVSGQVDKLKAKASAAVDDAVAKAKQKVATKAAVAKKPKPKTAKK